MTDAEILRQKLDSEESLLDEKGKEEFLTKINDFHDVFSLRDMSMSIHRGSPQIKR